MLLITLLELRIAVKCVRSSWISVFYPQRAMNIFIWYTIQTIWSFLYIRCCNDFLCFERRRMIRSHLNKSVRVFCYNNVFSWSNAIIYGIYGIWSTAKHFQHFLHWEIITSAQMPVPALTAQCTIIFFPLHMP